MNIKISLLTNGEKPIYADNFGFKYKVNFRKSDNVIDSVGCGDAFTAGFSAGLYHSLIFEESLRKATILGYLNAQKWDVCNIKKDELSNFDHSNIEIETIGKKIDSIGVMNRTKY